MIANERSRVVLQRRAEGLVDRARAYRVFIDDVHVGNIRRGQRMEFPVEPGEHVVHLRVDFMRSQRVPVVAPAGGEVGLYCEAAGKPVLYLFQMMFQPTRYITLRAIEGAASGSALPRSA